ncbi:MAG: carboxypeptidase regulatory-like domain-containing protein [Acidobacteriota bacterium]
MPSKSRLARWLGVLFLAIAAAAINAAGQYGTANIVGTVRDSSGAVIPGAKVTVQEPSKGFVRNLVTGTTGSYAINSVPIGTYTITFNAKGFMKVVHSGITLTTGQTQRVDAVMKVGGVTQQVTVQGNVLHVQTETASMSNVITGQQISQLEINGRNFVRLALLVPGATPVGLSTQTVGVMANNNISFNGSRTQYNNWTVDGAPNTDEGSASTFNTYPNLDSIAEFRISTSNYGAEYGHHSGAQIDVVTKSGTNKFHGNVSEYLRNDVLDAQNWFINRNDTSGTPPKRAPLKQNEYGFTLGGPFYIPGLYNTKKDKTFFFWSEDWRKIRGSSVISSSVPTAAERQGDFSQCDPGSLNYDKVVANSCVLPTLNGVTYDNVNSIPTSAILNTTQAGRDQAMANAQAFLNAYVPLPNSGPVGFTVSAPSATNWREDQIRVDQNLGDKTRVFVRFTHDSWNTVSVPTLWGWSSYDTVTTPFDGPGKSAVLNITNNFTPTLMNEFIAGYTADWITLNNKAGGSSQGIFRSDYSNFSLAHFFPPNSGNPLLPNLAVCGGTQFCFYEAAYSANPWTNSNPVVDLQDNVTWVHGNHVLKVGAYYEDYHKNETFGTAPQGELDFWSGQPGSTQNALADLFIGQMNSYTEGTQTFNGLPVGGNAKGHWTYSDFEPYVEDDWHVSSKLTLNLGLRYYLFQHIRDITKPTVDSGFIPSLYNPSAEAQYDANGNLIQGTGALPTDFGNGLVECGSKGIPPGCQYNTFKNFAPRFGFAYRLGHNTSIRGGYGIFYEIGNGNEAESEGGEGNPPTTLGLTAANLQEQHLGAIFDPSTGFYTTSIPPAGYTNWPTHQKWPSEQQFSLSVEHQVGNNDLFTLAYTGMQGRHLAMGYQSNMVPTGMGTVNVPVLAGKTGNDGSQVCDASGNCDVQNYLIHEAGTGVFFQPYRGYSGINTKADIAVSNYNALQASYRHSFAHGLTAQVAYTWAHSLDNASSTYTNNTRGVNPTNFTRWYATSDLNRAQVFTASYIYYLPFFKKTGNWFVRGALGGWEVSGITTFFTGTPVNILCGVNNYSTGIGGGLMCNSVGKLAIHKGTYNDPTYGPTPTWFNPGVIAQPLQSQLYANGEPGMFGYLGRNALTGPGRNDTDLALIKNWKVPQFGEAGGIQFRLETFNTFNHPSWTGFSAGCSGLDNFGQTCNSSTNDIGNGEVNGAYDPRIMQLGLQIKW